VVCSDWGISRIFLRIIGLRPGILKLWSSEHEAGMLPARPYHAVERRQYGIAETHDFNCGVGMSRCDEWTHSYTVNQNYFRQDPWILGALTKLRKATVSFVLCLSVCLPSRPSVCPPAHAPLCPSVRMQHLVSHWTDFHEIWNLSFSKICRGNSCFIKIWQEWRVLYMELLSKCVIISRLIFLRMTDISDKNCTENQNTYLCSVTFFFRKSYRLWDKEVKMRYKVTGRV